MHLQLHSYRPFLIKAICYAAILFFILPAHLSAQSTEEIVKTEFAKAQGLFESVYSIDNEKFGDTDHKYEEAVEIFLDLYYRDTTNYNLAFKIGVCYLNSTSQKKSAIPFLSKAIENTSEKCKEGSLKELRAPIAAYKFLADAQHITYDFYAAIENYEKYISLISDEEEIAKQYAKIQMCSVGYKLLAKPVNVKIENLGPEINSEYADYAPVLTADEQTIFFTSIREGSLGGLKDEQGNFMEDIYTSSIKDGKWSTAKNAGTNINTFNHEATVSISPDGQTILIYKDDDGDGNVYSTELRGDIWEKPTKLNATVNTEHWETGACMTANGNTLYFTSDKPGGFGGRDIYQSNRLPDGTWSKARNLGSTINTPLDEEGPFMHPDGVTLYFSSKGHETMGDFDVFTSTKLDSGKWTKPQNVGYPINTTNADVYYVISPNGLNAYFTSFRDGGYGEKDIYVAHFLDKAETPLAIVKGTVNSKNNRPIRDVKITVRDNETNEIVGIYRPNSKTGEYLFILPPGGNYNVVYESPNALFSSENITIPEGSSFIEVEKAVSIETLEVGSTVTLKNIFFDFDAATLRPQSNIELNNVIKLMNKNPKMKIELSAHTDSKGKDAYNMNLSQRRAKAAVDYLVKHGISAKRLIAKGYGETKPAAPNKNKDGSDNPEGRQLNRRVELTILQL